MWSRHLKLLARTQGTFEFNVAASATQAKDFKQNAEHKG